MVCDKCAKKLQKIIVPDTWKDGSMNNTGGEKAGILFYLSLFTFQEVKVKVEMLIQINYYRN